MAARAAPGGVASTRATLEDPDRTPTEGLPMPTPKTLMRHVLLLRGINLGPRKRVAMADLRQMIGDLGGEDVKTYIQSGNAVFDATAATAKKVRDGVEKRLEVAAALRTAEEFKKVVEGNPYDDPAHVHVAFLRDEPRSTDLDPDRSAGDEFKLHGREIYLHLPNGMARTKLGTAWFDAQLGTPTTMRNWRTVMRLHEMCSP